MKYEVINFGCRLNAYESEVIRKQLDSLPEADQPLLVFNSCAVTAEAERQLKQAIRKARRQSPEARIIVTGCAAQIDPGALCGNGGGRSGSWQPRETLGRFLCFWRSSGGTSADSSRGYYDGYGNCPAPHRRFRDP